MAITPTVLTSGDSTTNVSSLVTASITPTSNVLLLACVFFSDTVTTVTPTCAGNGLTWDLVVDQNVDAGASGFRHVAVFRASGTASAGAVTFTFSEQVSGTGHAILEFNTDTEAGNNGADAIIQTATAFNTSNVTSLSMTLAAFANATNNATVLCGVIGKNSVPSGDGSLIDLESGAHGSQPMGQVVAWQLGEDLTPSFSWASAHKCAGVAIEISATLGGGGADVRNHIIPAYYRVSA